MLVLLLCSFSLFASRPTVALVLSGGGAKGLAHIAVLEAVERYGIPIDMVLGTSMGALVGSLYAAGYSPKDIRAIAESPNLSDMFSENTFSSSYEIAQAFQPTHSNVFSLGFDKGSVGTSPGLLDDQKVMEMLSSVFSKLPDTLDFDDLETPFRCVGANVVTGEKIIYEDGSLITAVRSSISIPIIFTPYPQSDGSYAVDGGIVDNLPIQLAKDLGYDIIIACDVNATVQSAEVLLGSLSGMVMQTITLVTQIGSQSQYHLADLLIFPSLTDILAFDFIKYEQIIKEGEKACEAKAQEFSELAERIALSRPLVVKEKDRAGTYLSRPDPVIANIRVVDVSLFPSTDIPQKEHFSEFIGKPLDEETKLRLSQSLALIKKHYRLSSATYQMAYIREGIGDLVVFVQSFQKGESNISLGFSGSTGFSNNTPKGDLWLSYDARVQARIANIRGSNFSLEILATLGQTAKLKTSILYPIHITPNTSLDLDFSLTYEGGGFTPLNSMVNGERVVALDKGFTVDLKMDYKFLNYGRLDFGGLVDLVYLYDADTRGDPSFFAVPSLYASLVWDTQLSTFASSGVRGEFWTRLGRHERTVFGLQAAWRQRFSLNINDSFGYEFHLAMMRMPYTLLSSYVDLGGLSAFPGYSAGSLKRDIALAGVMYQHRLEDLLGYNSFLQVSAKVVVTDTFDPYDALPYPLGFWFSSPTEVDAGLSLGIGLQTPLGDIIVRIGASVLGQVSLAIEIL